MSSPARPPLRGNREFWLLWIGQATSTLGSQSMSIAIPLLVLSLTGSPVMAGVVGFVAAGSAVVLLLPAGVAADRVDRRMLMCWCDVGRATALAVLAATLVLGRPPLIELLALALVVGALSALFLAAQSGAVCQVVARTDLPAAIARNQAYQQVAGVGGPPLGGLLYSLAQFLPFLIDAVSYLFSCFTITAIRIPLQGTRDPPGSQQPVLHHLFDGLRWIFAEPFLRASILYAMVFNFIQPALVLAVIVRANAGDVTPTQIGMIFALSGIGGVVGALASSRIQERFPPGAVLLVIGIVCAASILLLAATTSSILLGGIMVVLGFIAPPVNTIVISFQMSITPDRLQGQANASMNLLASSSAPLGSLASGFLLAAIGSTGSLFVLAGIAAAAVVAASASTSLRAARRIDA